VDAVSAPLSPSQRDTLARFLRAVPATCRASMDRVTSTSTVSFSGPESLLPLLPTRLPRFRPGDRPLPGVDRELVQLLGMGGFGEVWKAKNPLFDGLPPVALKFCLDATARDRLLRHEAAVLNQ